MATRIRQSELTRSEFESRIEEFMMKFRGERPVYCPYDCGIEFLSDDDYEECEHKELSCPLVQNFMWGLVEEKVVRG